LGNEEFKSIFKDDGTLKGSIIDKSKSIMKGNELHNKSLIAQLTSDGSSIEDWSKKAYNVKKGLDGPGIDVHFYHNEKTNKSFYGLDYKSKLSSDYLKKCK